MSRRGIRFIRSLAEVHDMDIVEVGKIQSGGNVGGHLAEQVVDISFQVIDDIAEQATATVAGIEQAGVADARDV